MDLNHQCFYCAASTARCLQPFGAPVPKYFSGVRNRTINGFHAEATRYSVALRLLIHMIKIKQNVIQMGIRTIHLNYQPLDIWWLNNMRSIVSCLFHTVICFLFFLNLLTSFSRKFIWNVGQETDQETHLRHLHCGRVLLINYIIALVYVTELSSVLYGLIYPASHQAVRLSMSLSGFPCAEWYVNGLLIQTECFGTPFWRSTPFITKHGSVIDFHHYHHLIILYKDVKGNFIRPVKGKNIIIDP